MKRIRSFMTLAGLGVAFLALSAAGAMGQGFHATQFAGTFTLPTEAQWGNMTLPAGNYTLSYGRLNNGGVYAVQVAGKTKGTPHGVILAGPADQTSASENAIVCIRDGGALIVRMLDMPAAGESVSFALPRGTRILAQQRNHNTYAQLAEGPVLIQRVPVTLSGK